MTKDADIEDDSRKYHVRGYEKIEVENNVESIGSKINSYSNTFQKGKEEVALDKDIEEVVKIQISIGAERNGINMTDAEKFKRHSPSKILPHVIKNGNLQNNSDACTSLPPLEDPSIILTSPSFGRRTTEHCQGKYKNNLTTQL